MACWTPLARLRRLWWLITQGEDFIIMTSSENARLRTLTDAIRVRFETLTAKFIASEAGKPSPADVAESELLFKALEDIGKDPSNPLPDLPPVTP